MPGLIKFGNVQCILSLHLSTVFFLMQKFVCTTLRPTYLPYKELYNYDSCAAFVADYILYEPLKNSNELVRILLFR